MKLKEQFLNSKIYVPVLNNFVIGKFIPEKVLEKMSEKYPELFERIENPDPNMLISFEEELEQKIESMEPVKKNVKNEKID